jgi:hypothetical protein
MRQPSPAEASQHAAEVVSDQGQPPAEQATPVDQTDEEQNEVRCTLCGLRACWGSS